MKRYEEREREKMRDWQILLWHTKLDVCDILGFVLWFSILEWGKVIWVFYLFYLFEIFHFFICCDLLWFWNFTFNFLVFLFLFLISFEYSLYFHFLTFCSLLFFIGQGTIMSFLSHTQFQTSGNNNSQREREREREREKEWRRGDNEGDFVMFSWDILRHLMRRCFWIFWYHFPDTCWWCKIF